MDLTARKDLFRLRSPFTTLNISSAPLFESNKLSYPHRKTPTIGLPSKSTTKRKIKKIKNNKNNNRISSSSSSSAVAPSFLPEKILEGNSISSSRPSRGLQQQGTTHQRTRRLRRTYLAAPLFLLLMIITFVLTSTRLNLSETARGGFTGMPSVDSKSQHLEYTNYKVAVTVLPRGDPLLGYVLHNMFSHLTPEWLVQVFVGPEVEAGILKEPHLQEHLHSRRLIITPTLNGSLDYRGYSLLLWNPEFWKSIQGRLLRLLATLNKKKKAHPTSSLN